MNRAMRRDDDRRHCHRRHHEPEQHEGAAGSDEEEQHKIGCQKPGHGAMAEARLAIALVDHTARTKPDRCEPQDQEKGIEGDAESDDVVQPESDARQHDDGCARIETSETMMTIQRYQWSARTSLMLKARTSRACSTFEEVGSSTARVKVLTAHMIIAAVRYESTISRSKGGHSNIRNAPALPTVKAATINSEERKRPPSLRTLPWGVLCGCKSVQTRSECVRR